MHTLLSLSLLSTLALTTRLSMFFLYAFRIIYPLILCLRSLVFLVVNFQNNNKNKNKPKQKEEQEEEEEEEESEGDNIGEATDGPKEEEEEEEEESEGDSRRGR